MVMSAGSSMVSTADLGTEGGLRDRDVGGGVDVVAHPLEAVVGVDLELDEERAVAATAWAGRSAVREAQRRAVLDAGRHLDGEGPVVHAPALARRTPRTASG